MSQENNTVFHVFSVRMSWLRWLARPVIAVWRFLVSIGLYLWGIVRLAWRALVDSLNYRYWFLATVGTALAAFFVLSFYLLGNRLQLPYLVYLGGLIAILPLGWSFAEIASLLRRKTVSDSDFTIAQIRYQMGDGYRAVRILLKYVFFVVLFAGLQILLSSVIAVPLAGNFLYSLLMVPIAFFAFLTLVCTVLLVFGLAVFPVHVIYSQPEQGSGFLQRQVREVSSLLRIIRRRGLKIVLAQIPGVVFAAFITLFPVLVVGGSLLLYYFLTEQAGSLMGALANIPKSMQWLEQVVIGRWDIWGALTAFFLALSTSVLLGLLLSLFHSFYASLYFHIYSESMNGELGGGEEYEPNLATAGLGAVGATAFTDDDLFAPGMDDEKLSLEDLDREEDEVSGEDILASIESTMPIADTAAATTGAALSEDERLTIESLEEDDVSGEDILASIESTMPIADQAETLPGADLADFEDERLTMDSLEADIVPGQASAEEDDVSGEDILNSIESTMILATPDADSSSPPVVDLPQEELETLEDEYSGEDILASIESTMPIADTPQVIPDEAFGSQGQEPQPQAEESVPQVQFSEDIANLDLDENLKAEFGGAPADLEAESLLPPEQLEKENEQLAALDIDDALFQSSAPQPEGQGPELVDDDADLLADITLPDLDQSEATDQDQADVQPAAAEDEGMVTLDGESSLDDLLDEGEPTMTPDPENESLDNLLQSLPDVPGLDEDGDQPQAAAAGEQQPEITLDLGDQDDEDMFSLDDIDTDSLTAAPLPGQDVSAGEGGTEVPPTPQAEAGPIDLDVPDLDLGDLEAGGGIDLDDLTNPAEEPQTASAGAAGASPTQASPEPDTGSDSLGDLLDDLPADLGGLDLDGEAQVETEPQASVAADFSPDTGNDSLDDLLGDMPDDLGDLDTGAGDQDGSAASAEDTSGLELAATGGEGAPSLDDIDLDLGSDLDNDLLGGEQSLDDLLVDSNLTPVDEATPTETNMGDQADVDTQPAPELAAVAAGNMPRENTSAGASAQSVSAPSASAQAAAAETYFKGKGSAGAFTYLVNVKPRNQVLFGIKGSDGPGPWNFMLMLSFEGGQITSEMVTVNVLNEKGMGSTMADLSHYLNQEGYGKIVSVDVSPA